MRVIAITAAGVLAVGLGLSDVRAGGARSEPLHLITCVSSRAARDYDDGLRKFYLGELDRALKDFTDTAKRDPECPMAHWGQSRVLHQQGKAAEALAAALQAQDLAKFSDDREQKLVAGWLRFLKAQSLEAKERDKELNATRVDLDRAIAIYPGDPEMWLLRGVVAESPLRATPFNLAALKLRPDHPFGKKWSPTVPPAPQLTPRPTKPVPPVPEPPRLMEGLGVLSHPVTTGNPQAQAYYEQGLRCWHAYVSPMRNKLGAGVNFQHAANLDPELAMAYWGLSLCAKQGDAISPADAAHRALELALKKGTDKERRFCAARVLELSGKEKREEFLDALDGAIAAYPDDVELWIWRGKVYGTRLSAIPYQLAAHRLQPEHPSPNHELIHAYEGIDRPALGWPFTYGFRNSAPNMPHANHMQAHLAMRLGRWQEAIDCGRAARTKSLAGYPELDPGHHIDILMRALAHEGRFKEADSEPKAYRDGLPWARLLQLKAIPEELEAWVERRMEAKAVDAYYIGAIAKLDRNDLAGAEPLLANVEEQWKKRPANIYRYNEIKGRYLVQSGKVEEGLKLLREAGAKAVKDPSLHAWGGGSYVLEVWGEAALRAHRWDEAEEAFHEALAHEHGSIIGALGMQVVWEQRARPEMAEHYATRAAAIWKDADEGALERQLQRLRRLATGSAAAAPTAKPRSVE